MLAGICRFRPFFPAQLHDPPHTLIVGCAARIRASKIPLSKPAGAMALAIARSAATEIGELPGFIVVKGGRLDLPVPNAGWLTGRWKGARMQVQRRVAKPR
jgi:2-dehydropantoate 2-reductase